MVKSVPVSLTRILQYWFEMGLISQHLSQQQKKWIKCSGTTSTEVTLRVLVSHVLCCEQTPFLLSARLSKEELLCLAQQ